jgi:NADH-ubiquinone oxidoreductase chain 2
MPKISIFIFLLEFTGGAIGSETVIDMGTSNALFLGENTSGAIFKNLLLTTSLLSLVIGTVVGLAQYRLKRLLAFSTISHVGFLLLALSVNSEESITSFLFYIIQYSITNLDAFFVVLALGYVINNQISYENNGNNSTDITYISQLKGQFYANPILGLSLALCLFSMAGIPPLVGFFAKYRVLYSAIENGYYFLAFVGIIASVISAAYYLRIIRVAYYLRIIRVIHFDQRTNNLSLESGQKSEPTFVLTSRHSYIISVLTLLVVLFILSPSLVLNSSNLLALSLFTA